MSGLRTLDPATRRGKPIHLIVVFLFVFVTFVFVIDMLTMAWTNQGLVRQFLANPLSAVGLNPGFFLYLPLGIVIGLVATLLLDSFKYVQGVLIAIAFIGAFGVTYYLPKALLSASFSLSFEPAGLVLAALIALATARFSGVGLESLSDNIREFPRAPTALFWVTSLVCVVGFLDAHVIYGRPIGPVLAWNIAEDALIRHVLASAVLLASLRYLTSYERGLRVIMIGPARSGKSAIIGGLHLYIRDHVDESGEAAFLVNRIRSSIENGEFPQPTQMAVQAGSGTGSRGGQPSLLALPYRWGRFFPRRVKFHGIDYPGEALDRILDPVVRQAEELAQGFDRPVRSDGGKPSDSDDPFDVPFSEEGIDETNDRDDDFGEPVEREHPISRQGDTEEELSHRAGDIDQPGQKKLFDTTSDAGGTEPLRQLRRSIFGDDDDHPTDPMDTWENATETIRVADNIDEMLPGIRGCIHNADRIVLTLPLDDFVAPIIKRGNVPSYLADRVIDVDELDKYRRSDVRTIHFDGETYAINSPFNRAAPEDYLYWYEALRSVYPDTEFIVVGTMADWMLEDFREAQRVNVSPLAEGYDAFCEHVLDEVVREQTPMINGVLGGRNQGRIHLLWYSIANDAPPGEGEKLRIDTSGPYAVLKGAEQFLDRIHEDG